jgi:Uma2 family endonuclease
MATVTTRPMTAEEFYEWVHRPENLDRVWELEQGEVVEMPSPGEVHGVLCALITHLLWQYVFRRGSGYVCSNDTGLIVEEGPDTVRGPDIMMFDDAVEFEQLDPKYTKRVPKLVVEVRSPNDQPTKMTKRASQYLKRGVPIVWLVDPEVRSVTVCRLDRFPTVLDDTDEVTGEEVLADLKYRVAEFFVLPRKQP